MLSTTQLKYQSRNWVILGLLGIGLWSCSKPVPDIQVPSQASQTRDSQDATETRDRTNESNRDRQDISDANPSRDSNDKPRDIVYVAEPLDNEPAQLISNNPKSRINVRDKPTTQSTAKHYGLKGDRVTLLKKAKGEGDYIWYYVRFEKSKAEGWIREDFIVSDEFIDAEGVVPFNYSGRYDYTLPETDTPITTFDFKQTRSQINFTVATDLEFCNPQDKGSAFFVPESNEFVGNTANGELTLTFTPEFVQGKFTGQFNVKSKLANPPAEPIDFCDYSGLYASR